MANCPKCGRKLTLLDWKPNCPECGVNLVYYGMEERLMDEADKAEAEHARLQKRIDRLKASFVGSKLAIVRIILSVLPIAALLLPLASISFNGPYIEATTTTINAIEIYNLVSSLDFDALFTMIGSGVVGSSFIGYAGALVGILLSLVFVILSLLLLMLACSPKGCVRNLIMNSLAIVAAVVSIVMFTQFANGITAVFPDFVTDASIGFGIFVYIGMLALLLGLNIYLTINKIEVKYKQCYVGGIPAEEYFELVEKGTDKEILHKMMAEALAEKTEAKEEAKEEVNA
ncbi:MAG: hypothetical protein U0M02_14315 [Acutalibacteraceae bacterium]|nr:hypothetical protein [Acutalibacteraceae bacterium]